MEEGNMNKLMMLALSVIAVPAVTFAVDAPIVKAPKEACSNIEWNPDFLKDYPKAPAACREVVVKDGIKFATFNGKVSKVGHNFVQVEISDVSDYPIGTIAFQIGSGGTVTVNDKVEKVKDLQTGDQLTFWVREARFGVSPTLADQPMKIVKPEAMSKQ
jgi:hypothetical protein